MSDIPTVTVDFLFRVTVRRWPGGEGFPAPPRVSVSIYSPFGGVYAAKLGRLSQAMPECRVQVLRFGIQMNPLSHTLVIRPNLSILLSG